MHEAASKNQWSVENDAALSNILHQRFQRLSPLDAFKARGKLLHEHLKKQGSDYARSNQTQIRPRSEKDTVHRRQHDDLVKTFAHSSLSPHSSIFTNASKNNDVLTLHSTRECTTSLEEISIHGDMSSDPRLPRARSNTPSNMIKTPELDSLHSSPTGSAYSATSSSWSHTGRSMQSLHPTSPSSSHETKLESSASPFVPSTFRNLSGFKEARETEWTPNDNTTLEKQGAINASAYSPQHQNYSITSNGRSPSVRSPSSSRHVSIPVESRSRSDSHQRPPLTPGRSNRSTLPARSAKTPLSAIERFSSIPDHVLGAAEHIELGIEQHEQDQLPQSTHHFKVAADLGDPTGCMLYGLALRHGWGCRKDLSKSLHFLRSAADSATLNIENIRQSKIFKVPVEEIAVAVYELGVSYQNGWGVVADKKASLKYFDLAASWGDLEAMAAAAECYSNGRGCNKDKKKAATYLRYAESKGRKEVGNAWIWKEKYDLPSTMN